MRLSRGFQSLVAGSVMAVLLGGAAYSFSGTVRTSDDAEIGALISVSAGAGLVQNTEAADAAESFVRSMTKADAETVWMFASEEDQEAFGTEAEIYSAFADTFPVLTDVKEVSLTKSWREGDTPFVALSLEDSRGQIHRANVGMWLDDAGDWKVVSCDIAPALDQVASR